jgi:hypothetical protein
VYDNKNNIIKAMKRFQGRQVNKINLEVMTVRLEAYFVSINYPAMEVIRGYPLNAYGKRADTSVPMMIRALKKIGMSGEFKNVNFIGRVIWNWELPCIDHLEEQILADYDATQRVFNTLEGTRKSSLSTQFRLLKHLEICNFTPLKAEDFKLPETDESITYHETTWRIMCEGSGDPRIKYKPTAWSRRGV